jgi:hypothetical protein
MMNTKSSGFALLTFVLALMIAIPAPLFAQTAAEPAGQTPTGQAQSPQPPEGGVNWGGAGYGAATVLADVIYVPVKVVYALLGVFVGAGTWALTAGNTQVANTVWRSALGGDYVLTPGMIEGKEPINFSGPTETAPEAAAAAPAPSPAAAAYGTPAPAAGGLSSQPIDRGSGPMAPTERTIE